MKPFRIGWPWHFWLPRSLPDQNISYDWASSWLWWTLPTRAKAPLAFRLLYLLFELFLDCSICLYLEALDLIWASLWISPSLDNHFQPWRGISVVSPYLFLLLNSRWILVYSTNWWQEWANWLQFELHCNWAYIHSLTAILVFTMISFWSLQCIAFLELEWIDLKRVVGCEN